MNSSTSPEQLLMLQTILSTRPIEQLMRKVDIVISILSILLNTVHFTVLFHPNLRFTAIFTIFCFISISDIILMLSQIFMNTLEIISYQQQYCLNQGSYWNRVLMLISFMLGSSTSYTSTWLLVIIASFRALSLKYPMATWTDSLSKSSIAVKASCSVEGACFGYCLLVFIMKNSIVPGEGCVGGEMKEEQYKFQNRESPIMFVYIFMILDVLIEMLMIIFYIFFSILLMKSVKEAAKLRRVMIQSGVQRNKDNLSKLILWMIFLYLLSEIPIVLLNAMTPLVMSDSNFLYYLFIFSYFANSLKTLNSSSHIFVCILMSTSYRETFNLKWKLDRFRAHALAARVEDVTRA